MTIHLKQINSIIATAALIVLSAAIFPAGAMAEDQTAYGYRIGPGDILDISAWKNTDLTKMVIVRPDGRLSFPLIGEIQASGKTVIQLEKEITARLTRFIPDPNLSVVVHQVNSLLIYVIGKVNNPGRFLLNSNINVLQALAMAGGLNTFAERHKIKVFRNRNGKTAIFNFDYDAVSAGKNLQQNILLMRGDVVVVR